MPSQSEAERQAAHKAELDAELDAKTPWDMVQVMTNYGVFQSRAVDVGVEVRWVTVDPETGEQCDHFSHFAVGIDEAITGLWSVVKPHLETTLGD